MREIIFRGKIIDNGGWIYGYLVKSEDYIFDYSERIDIPYIIPIDNFNLKDYREYRVEEETVGQFTGLYDKDKKPIYEGDIVEYAYCINADYEQYSKGIIKYIGSSFVIFEKDSMVDTNYVYNLEVIGNIYDEENE